MSYILEALKKSERERQRGSVPDLHTIQAVQEASPTKRRALWPLLACAVLLVNAAILLWWSRPWSPASPPLGGSPIVTPAPSNEIQPKAPAEVLPPVAAPTEAKREPSGPSASQPNRPLAPVPSPTPQKETPFPARPEGLAEEPQPAIHSRSVAPPLDLPEVPQVPPTAPKGNLAIQQPSPPPPTPSPTISKQHIRIPVPDETEKENSPVAGTSATALQHQVVSLAELPATVRDGLPGLAISLHRFAHDPSARLVSVDGQILRQGQKAKSGPMVEEITENGVIFQYQGYRFLKVIF